MINQINEIMKVVEMYLLGNTFHIGSIDYSVSKQSKCDLKLLIRTMSSHILRQFEAKKL